METNMIRTSIWLFLIATIFTFGSGSAVADDHDWPRQIDSRDATIIVYQPQIESFENNILSARSAVSVQHSTDTEPVFGAVWFEAQTETDREQRNVSLRNVRVLQHKFPNATKEQAKRFNQIFNREASGWNLDMSLDQMLTMLDDNNRANVEVRDLRNNPPKVFFRMHPSLLVLIDGEPKLQPIKESKVLRVANSPMYIVYEASLKSYYLKIGDEWFASAKAKGKWRSVTQPPTAILEVAAREDFPPVPPEVQSSLDKKPEIIVTYEPAELIVSEGEPQYALIEESGLLYMSNSDSDVFMEVDSQNYYVVLSGRWYRSRALSGPWVYVPADELPAVIKRIPADSVKEHVLAHIPDTVQSKEAILDATIPQTEKVDRGRTIEIEYDGTPEFDDVIGTEMAYAINTSSAVLRVDGRYYACLDAVWFVAASPYGPWRVAITIPQVIYTIPPSNPLYYVRYVYIYGYTPDIVYIGYTPGYLGTYIYHGTVVYGTGYYYQPWYRTHYYPRPLTWGFHVNYNSYYGWSFGVGLHGHYGNLWYSFGTGWWGPIHHRHHYYNDININISRNTIIKRPGNIYRPVSKEKWQRTWQEREKNKWNSKVKKRESYRRISEKEKIKARRSSDKKPRTDEIRNKSRDTSRRNDVYTDRKGNVYRRNDSGWEKREKKKWQPDEKLKNKDNGKSREKSLNREYKARERGNERSRKVYKPQREKSFQDFDNRGGSLTRPHKKGRKF